MQSVLRLLQLYADEMYGVWVRGKQDEGSDDEEEEGGEEGGSARQSTADGERETHATPVKQSAQTGRAQVIAVHKLTSYSGPHDSPLSRLSVSALT